MENEQKAVTIQLSTHTPEQWRFVDLRSGEVWKWVKRAVTSSWIPRRG